LPWFAITAGVLLIVVVLVWRLARRPMQAEIVRLKNDVHELLAKRPSMRDRLVINGREGSFVDIAASVNRLLDRARSSEEQPDAGSLFDALTDTLPEIALVHSHVIFFANRAAAELFGVDAATLVDKPVTDLMRPA